LPCAVFPARCRGQHFFSYCALGAQTPLRKADQSVLGGLGPLWRGRDETLDWPRERYMVSSSTSQHLFFIASPSPPPSRVTWPVPFSWLASAYARLHFRRKVLQARRHPDQPHHRYGRVRGLSCNRAGKRGWGGVEGGRGRGCRPRARVAGMDRCAREQSAGRLSRTPLRNRATAGVDTADNYQGNDTRNRTQSPRCSFQSPALPPKSGRSRDSLLNDAIMYAMPIL